MGKTFSRATYSPNPIKTAKCCGSCASCSPFGKKSKDDDIPRELPKPPVYDIDDKDDNVPHDPALLAIQSVDLLIKSNSEAHRTHDYHLVEKEKPHLVIRRGQPFYVKLSFNRKYQPEQDVICFVFTDKDAKSPNYSQETLISVPVFDEVTPSSKEWSAKCLTTNDSVVTVQIFTPCNMIVGAWKLDIDTKLKNNEGKAHRYSHADPIYIIFNPWCADDTIYMDDEEKVKEYVLNDSGLIWRGSHSSLRPTPWNFAQFEENILECAIYMLNYVGHLRKGQHSDPVMICRHLSAVVNSPDDSGVIEGNWSGDYQGGEPPTKWAGSKIILQQFYKTQKPVKFGQCWVFAGVLTTVCRALGIPSRVVTNFSSAHDTHQSLTIDIFCDEEGKILDDLTRDSIWNFHVWNEVWMTRPDLEPGDYSGWQAIDSTPQEASDGFYRCGPASVTAVKKGEIKKGYDVDFLFAEVNADKIFWRYWGPMQPLKLISKQQQGIGMFISTKAVGSFKREDITNEYKYPENSEEERSVMLAALRQSGSMFSRYYLNEDFEDVQFDFQLYDDIIIGQSFKVTLKMKNKSRSKPYDITANLRVDTMLYTGAIKRSIKKKSYETHLKPGHETSLVLEVMYEDYEGKLEEHNAFSIAAMAKVVETDFEYFGQDDFRVRMPDILIETEGKLVQHQEFTVNVRLKNPLSKPLRKGEFNIEGPGLGSPMILKLPANVEPGEEASATCKLTPVMSGQKTIVAKFTSKDLQDVDGYKNIYITSKSTDHSNNDVPLTDIGNGRGTD